MSNIRILVYYGKHGDQYWVANTSEQAAKAREALFRQLDEEGCYDGEDIEFLKKARTGDIQHIAVLLGSRRECEYERWAYIVAMDLG